MKNSRPTQVDRVIDYMEKNGSINQFDAIMKLGILRLASRISEIKHKREIPIGCEWVTVTNRYGEKCRVKSYFMESEG